MERPKESFGEESLVKISKDACLLNLLVTSLSWLLSGERTIFGKRGRPLSHRDNRLHPVKLKKKIHFLENSKIMARCLAVSTLLIQPIWSQVTSNTRWNHLEKLLHSTLSNGNFESFEIQSLNFGKLWKIEIRTATKPSSSECQAASCSSVELTAKRRLEHRSSALLLSIVPWCCSLPQIVIAVRQISGLPEWMVWILNFESARCPAFTL